MGRLGRLVRPRREALWPRCDLNKLEEILLLFHLLCRDAENDKKKKLCGCKRQEEKV